ncbi:unnamed protein product [Rodentolepis nana]|uniref:E3 ubiquitin-protein ligase CHIP n=1 Tax=Rodentolepis nana TaxID=102285 RepID=A0A0R3TM52_RODNA|nr:unnamed protein product [Rodentolepis nana]
MSHSELKDSGNRFFAASDNKRAIECYTMAIKKNGSISTYYSNRALCYLQLKMYDQALADCRRALELDPNNLKAFFFAGQCHLAVGQYDEAIAKLTTTHSLALETHKNFGDDITASIRLAKRKRFEQLDEKRKQEEIELQSYLSKLIIEDGKRLLRVVSGEDSNKSEEDSKKKFSENKTIEDDDKDITDVNVQVSIRKPPLTASQIEAETAARLRDLDAIFAQIDDRRAKREIPDYLCGQISFELMQDPVITPSGITYERESIQAHLRRVGHFDPITRQPLTQEQLIPNLAMKEAMSDQKEEILTANASRFARRRGRGRTSMNMRRRLVHHEEEVVTGASLANETTTNNNSSDGSDNNNQMANISDMTPIDPDDECVICRDRKVNQSFLIPCMHTYCYQCILRWVRINPTCPLCKAAAQKIIHSINSDTDFREYEIRSHQSPHHIPSGIHIHSSSPHMFFTLAHDILAAGPQSPHGPEFNPVQLRAFDLSSRIHGFDPRAEALLALTSHALRSPLSPDLLRRLAYVNRLVSFPTNSTLPICTVFEVIAKLRDSQPRSTYIRSLELFCRREIGYLAPWLDYSTYRNAPALEVACKPIGSQALCVTSRSVKNLSRRIIQCIHANPYRLNSVAELASEIRRIDRYTAGGDDIFQLLSGGTLQRFAWEIIQFSRFNGSVNQYYDEISLFRDDIIRHRSDPVLSNAVYSSANCGTRTRFAHNFDDICRNTAQWLFRKLTGATHSPYTPPASSNAIRPLEQIGCSLRDPSIFNPRSILSHGNFAQHRIEGIRALLSFMCIRYHSLSPQTSVIELIDMGRSYGICGRLSTFDHRLLTKRLANVTFAFTNRSIELGSLHDITDNNTYRVFAEEIASLNNNSQQLRVPDDSHLYSSRFIVVSDEDSSSSSSSSSSDDVQLLSETRPTTSSTSDLPCCRAHKRHCCCCKKRTPRVTTNEPSIRVEGISALFQEFLEYWEHRRKRRRVEPIEINTPNDPIVISDDEEGDNESSHEPGPSIRHPEDDLGIVEKTEEGTELKQNILPLPTSISPQLERPETADEFYTLLNDAMNRDNSEEAQQPSAHQQEDSPAFLLQIEQSKTSDNDETSSQILLPNSSPTPISES